MKTLKNLMGLKSQTAKKYIVVIAVASLASLAAFSEAAPAEKGMDDAVPHHKDYGDTDGKRGGHIHRYKDHIGFVGAKLDLTEAQKEAMKAARAANEASRNELHENLLIAHTALDKAIDASADDAMLNKLTTDLASLIAQKELAQAKMRRDFLNLLTPEQKQKLADFEVERKGAPRWKEKKTTKLHAE